MGRAPCCDKANVKKGPWSPEEDAKLKEFIEKFGTGGNWIALPQKAGLKRCGKSCRLRWLNYLRPNIRHGEFSDDEDRIICSLYASIGSRWSVIAAQLPGRTDNDIKNYWNTKLKKKLLTMFPSLQEKQTFFPSMSSCSFQPPPPPPQFDQNNLPSDQLFLNTTTASSSSSFYTTFSSPNNFMMNVDPNTTTTTSNSLLVHDDHNNNVNLMIDLSSPPHSSCHVNSLITNNNNIYNHLGFQDDHIHSPIMQGHYYDQTSSSSSSSAMKEAAGMAIMFGSSAASCSSASEGGSNYNNKDLLHQNQHHQYHQNIKQENDDQLHLTTNLFDHTPAASFMIIDDHHKHQNDQYMNADLAAGEVMKQLNLSSGGRYLFNDETKTTTTTTAHYQKGMCHSYYNY